MPLSQIFYVANRFFKAIRENKILAKISEFTVTCVVRASQLQCSKGCELEQQNLPACYLHGSLLKTSLVQNNNFIYAKRRRSFL